VVDDASTDDTVEALSAISLQDPRVRVLAHSANRHASAARNTGLASAKGELIAFLDDDDIWLPDKLQKQVECLTAAGREVGLVYCWFDVYRGDVVVGTRRPRLSGRIFDELLISQPIGNSSTLLCKREVIERIGGFDEGLRRGNDGDFIRRVALHYEIEVVPEVLVHYFVDHDGYARITGDNYKSIINSIRGHKAKLLKFSRELQERPKQHGALLSVIGRQYARVGEVKKAFEYLSRAVRVQPKEIRGYLRMLLGVIDFLFRRARA
jgi:glycosyltransferase involved in cell wall biosynthesis